MDMVNVHLQISQTFQTSQASQTFQMESKYTPINSRYNFLILYIFAST